jgi:predicted ATPase
MERLGHCQVIMATHSPLLMAYPGARLLLLSRHGLDPISIEQTEHFRLIREFCTNPVAFVDSALDVDAGQNEPLTG